MILSLTDEAKLKIADEGYDPEYGARPLRRALQKHVEDRLSEELLRGTVLTGGKVIVDVENGEFVVKTKRQRRERRSNGRKIKDERDSPPAEVHFWQRDCPFLLWRTLWRRKKSKFMCKSCGYESPKWMGRCPGCGEWNTMDEAVEIVQKGPRGAFQHSDNVRQKAMPINAIETVEEPRIGTDLGRIEPGTWWRYCPWFTRIDRRRSWNREIDVAYSKFPHSWPIRGYACCISQVRNRSGRRSCVQNGLVSHRMNFISTRKQISDQIHRNDFRSQTPVCNRRLNPNSPSSRGDFGAG